MSIPEKSEKESLKELGVRVDKCKKYYAALLSVRQQSILDKISEYVQTKIPRMSTAKREWYDKPTRLMQSLNEWHVGEVKLNLGNSLWILLNQIRASKGMELSNKKFKQTFTLKMKKDEQYQGHDTFGIPDETPTDKQVVSFYDERSFGYSSSL